MNFPTEQQDTFEFMLNLFSKLTEISQELFFGIVVYKFVDDSKWLPNPFFVLSLDLESKSNENLSIQGFLDKTFETKNQKDIFEAPKILIIMLNCFVDSGLGIKQNH
jgi:hypothetical protein